MDTSSEMNAQVIDRKLMFANINDEMTHYFYFAGMATNNTDYHGIERCSETATITVIFGFPISRCECILCLLVHDFILKDVVCTGTGIITRLHFIPAIQRLLTVSA